MRLNDNLGDDKFGQENCLRQNWIGNFYLYIKKLLLIYKDMIILNYFKKNY